MTHPPGQPSPEKRALIEAYDHAVKTEEERAAERRAAPPPPRRGPSWTVILSTFVLVALLVWLAVERPAWLLDRGMPAESAEVRDASLRLAMAMQFNRVRRYQDSAGRLPARLEETGPVLEGIRYEAGPGSTFTLVGRNGPHELTLRSTDTVRVFVGDSYTVLEGRAAR